jgi:acetyl-CoA carboxylase biotin carboxyl carrier protein
MLKMHEVRELIKLFEESSLQEMEIEFEGEEASISLKKHDEYSVYNPKKNYEDEMVSVPQHVMIKEVNVNSEISKEILESSKLEAVKKEPNKNKIVENSSLHKIVSPMVGTFYQSPSEGEEPFVVVGNRVNKSSVVCILEAMKLFNEIEAEVNGEVVEIMVENGQLVDYGQPLFLIKIV